VATDGFKKCTSRPAPSACRFLQQNRHIADALVKAAGGTSGVVLALIISITAQRRKN